jgi:hypothetical protein
MSTKYVQDTAAGKSISAYIVLKNGKEVATIRAQFSNGGTCLVNVFSMDGTPFQHGKASGYGYDKFTAAISGLTVDGITLSDHCGRDEKTEKLLKAYRKACEKIGEVQYGGDFQKSWNKKAAKLGATFANWNRDNSGYSSLHIASGLDRLKMLGYQVIQAI